MCQRVPFHHKANANSNDLKVWSAEYLDMPVPLQNDHTNDIRREINLANMKKRAAGGDSTRIIKPNIVPTFD